MASARRDLSRRSMHVVPGSSARFLAKAPALRPDAFMLDLEDGVAPSEKELARDLVVAALLGPGLEHARRTVRVNAAETAWMALDVAAVLTGARGRVDALVLPKAGAPGEVSELDRQIHALERALGLSPGLIGIEVIIESAPGVVHLDAILEASPRVEAVLFGPLDFAASLGMAGADSAVRPSRVQLEALMAVRTRILIAGRAAGVAVLDGPFFRLGDEVGLREEARVLAELGFDGKLSIHPDQIEVLNDAFAPSQAEFDRAVAVLDRFSEAEEAGIGAVRFDGSMIDAATRRLVEATIARGERAGLRRSRPS